MTIKGQLIDVWQRRTYAAELHIADGKIVSVQEIDAAPLQYIIPGFVDAHIHIESSMLVPSAFAPMAVVHGTVATVSDPHEIANVCGIDGVRYMIDNAKQTPFKFFFGAPSCVPATTFETAGATLDADAVATLLADDDIWYLSEMMNYPGVLYRDPGVMAKIAAAHAEGKPVDGHAPGMRGADVITYAAAGISTDHECISLDEALDKIAAGMHILIREGSAAKNFEALHTLLRLHPDRVMLCSDDKHPDELLMHHVNELVRRAVAKEYDVYDVLRAASVNPVTHYKLPVGLLRAGDPADFLVVDSLKDFGILQTWIDGQLVAANGQSHIAYREAGVINSFAAEHRAVTDFEVVANGNGLLRVIVANEGQLVTGEKLVRPTIVNGLLVSNTDTDVLKIAVVNRYEPMAPVVVAFIINFGLKEGAIASTVGHDCHNIIVVGVTDEAMCAAVNALIDCKGGIAVTNAQGKVHTMPLPVAGLMSGDEGHKVAADYTKIDQLAKQLGTPMQAPFMTLSFMALLVIPALKLSDKGLFDGSSFAFTTLQETA
jgi:adenine deaminase